MNDKVKIEKLIGSFTNKKWQLFLFPTEACNFRCSYCYEKQLKKGRMSDDVLSAVKKLIVRRASTNELAILILSWFGGEPLLTTDIIYDMSDYIRQVSENTNNFKYFGSVTTNGFLLSKDVANKLVTLGNERFQISLDGTRDMHNKTRFLADGKGTFDTIWSNLIDIKNSKLDIEIVIRLHLHAHNIDDIAVLIEQIKSEFGDDKRFVVFIKPIFKIDMDLNDSDFNLFLSDQNKTKEIIADLYSLLNGEEIRALDLGAEGNICYAAKPNSIIVRADGSLAKCTLALDDDRNNIGKLNSDGTLDIDKSKFMFWTRGWLENEDPSALYCPYSNGSNDLSCVKRYE